jgi:hypothetical protein
MRVCWIGFDFFAQTLNVNRHCRYIAVFRAPDILVDFFRGKLFPLMLGEIFQNFVFFV